MVRTTLFAGLLGATSFQFEHGTLWIVDGGSERFFSFERMAPNS